MPGEPGLVAIALVADGATSVALSREGVDGHFWAFAGLGILDLIIKRVLKIISTINLRSKHYTRYAAQNTFSTAQVTEFQSYAGHRTRLSPTEIL